LNFRKISITTEDIFRKLFLGVTFQDSFHPLKLKVHLPVPFSEERVR